MAAHTPATLPREGCVLTRQPVLQRLGRDRFDRKREEVIHYKVASRVRGWNLPHVHADQLGHTLASIAPTTVDVAFPRLDARLLLERRDVQETARRPFGHLCWHIPAQVPVGLGKVAVDSGRPATNGSARSASAGLRAPASVSTRGTKSPRRSPRCIAHSIRWTNGRSSGSSAASHARLTTKLSFTSSCRLVNQSVPVFDNCLTCLRRLAGSQVDELARQPRAGNRCAACGTSPARWTKSARSRSRLPTGGTSSSTLVRCERVCWEQTAEVGRGGPSRFGTGKPDLQEPGGPIRNSSGGPEGDGTMTSWYRGILT